MEKITVRTSDGHEFELEEHLALQSAPIKTSLDLPGETVPLSNVNNWEMVKVIAFFTKLQELETSFGVKLMEKKDDRFLEAFQKEFDKDLSDENLVCLLCAVSYLEIEVLQEIMCRLMAERIKTKSLDYCRDLFGVSSDYTPEEEAKNRKDYCWAFEGSEIEKYKRPARRLPFSKEIRKLRRLSSIKPPNIGNKL
ncbi:hypothetical protein ACLB2K_032425 [Fragaria x ananassa]